MLVIETRIPAVLFANILHYLKEEHQIQPRNRSEGLRFALFLLSKLTPETFTDEGTAMEYITSVCGGTHKRDERIDKASQEVMVESRKQVDFMIEDAIKKFKVDK